MYVKVFPLGCKRHRTSNKLASDYGILVLLIENKTHFRDVNLFLFLKTNDKKGIPPPVLYRDHIYTIRIPPYLSKCTSSNLTHTYIPKV